MEADHGRAAELLAESARADGLVLLIPVALMICLALRAYHILIAPTWGIATVVLLEPEFGLAPPQAIHSSLPTDPRRRHHRKTIRRK
jgi:hypothetical protein